MRLARSRRRRHGRCGGASGRPRARGPSSKTTPSSTRSAIRAGASSTSSRDGALAAEAAAGAQRVRGVQRGRVVLADRRGDAALGVVAVRGGERRPSRAEHVGLVGRASAASARRRRRRRRPGEARTEGFILIVDNPAGVYMVSDPKAKTRAPTM